MSQTGDGSWSSCSPSWISGWTSSPCSLVPHQTFEDGNEQRDEELMFRPSPSSYFSLPFREDPRNLCWDSKVTLRSRKLWSPGHKPGNGAASKSGLDKLPWRLTHQHIYAEGGLAFSFDSRWLKIPICYFEFLIVYHHGRTTSPWYHHVMSPPDISLFSHR